MFYLLIFNFEFLIINYYLLFMWGKYPPKLHPCLSPAIAGYPVAFALRDVPGGNALCLNTTVWQGTPTNLIVYEKIIRIFVINFLLFLN